MLQEGKSDEQSYTGSEKRTMVLAFKKAGSGVEEPVETTLAKIHDQGFTTIEDFVKAEDMRLAPREEIIAPQCS